ncbi:putative radical SAM enzyme, TIGR03279 family [Butyrivibrio sp. ob235]|uniref:DUF512 domain-containing protein n=1 Tax=Butyrivibrio sp. ob235 TaxID=1761780 RepID=UPI0008B66108|nr:DUF512 domain-containing protein [Butyrivibrio sp. ob235]SEK46548.1 putative radical SAM enzyme, TIGR03279 family [Butyrivibrio sp. ob235]
MDNKGHLIKKVEPGSIADELEIAAGDYLLAINGQPIEDIFDYQYMVQDEELTLLVRKPDGEEWELDIEKYFDEDLGIEFDNGLMDDYRSCCNKCIFCFIDQMPPGMRETLYFKDDDARLSFLQGNYVTLTNMSDKDIDRILKYHLSPINVSFQTTNPELRCKMLNNRFAGEALKKVDRLCEPGTGIELNGQIVLCKGVNDGEELHRSLTDLYNYRPNLKSVSVVPVGLSKYRDGLFPLEPFEKDDAVAVIKEINYWQEKSFEEYGDHFVHASDEWYMIAQLPIPPAQAYDDYGQLENGVGMVRLLLDEFDEALRDAIENGVDGIPLSEYKGEVSTASGRLIYPFICEMARKLTEAAPGLTVHVHEIINNFFGERITVTGLLTGQDIIAQLKGQKLGDALILPQNVLRAGEDYLLDDVRVSDIESELGVKVRIIKSGGMDFIRGLITKQDGIL